MKKALGVVGIIVLVLLTIFLIHTTRNFIIVTRLQNNIEKYKTSTNFHIKSVSKDTRGIIMTANFYRKDKKRVSIVERNMDGEIARISVYGEYGGQEFNTYIENSENKIAVLNENSVSLNMEIYNGVESDSSWHTFLSSMFTFIGSEKINGKKCYVVHNYPSFLELISVGNNIYYIEEDTGLMIKSITNNQTADKEYEFDNVDDNVFAEPDISEYTIREN